MASREQQLQEILVEYLESVEQDRAPAEEEWQAQHPEFAAELAEFFAGRHELERLAPPLRQSAMDEATVAPQNPAEPDAQAREAVSLAGASGSVVQTGIKLRYVGDYELLEEIARGGMGVVYKARQVKLKRTVAVKMILAGELANQTDVERFHTEARAAANLHHANIVAIHEVGQHEGQHYFSMDYVAGESLAHKIARGPLPAREAATLIKKVAAAVSFAHVEGVIHRDLKPANILLDAQSEPHVTDFGLAKRVQSEPGASATGADLTHTGQVLGTPSYMPPEQAGGKTKEIGPRSDVYSLGAVLYCALTGRPPFQAASTLDTLLQVLDREPVSPRSLNSAVPRDLETICLKCLEKDPRRRYTSAKELVDELGRFLEGKPILARPVGRIERSYRWCRRNPTLAGLQFALGLSCVAMVFIALLALKEANRSAELANKAIDLAADARKAEDRATTQERLTRRHLFAAHMNLANDAWKNGNAVRVVELLNQHRPQKDEDDLRSFDWRYLWQELNRQQKTIPLTKGRQVSEWQVDDFPISSDGRHVAVFFGSMGNFGFSKRFDELQLWDLTSGKLRKTIKGDIDPERRDWPADKQYEAFVFSRNSKLFAMVTWDFPLIWEGDAKSKEGRRRLRTPRLTVYDLQTMKLRRSIPLPEQDALAPIDLGGSGFHFVIAVAAKHVAAGYWEKGHKQSTVKIWDLPEDDQAPLGPAKTLHRGWKGGGQPGFDHFLFTLDAQHLAWASQYDPELVLTDLTGMGKDRTLPIKTFAFGLVFSPDGKYVAAWDTQGNHPYPLRLFDAVSGKPVHTLPPTASIRVPLRFSPDSKILALAPKFNSLELWDVQTKQQVGDIRGHTDRINDFGFGADKGTVITVSRNRFAAPSPCFEARIWNMNTRLGPAEFPLPAPPFGIAPDGKTLATLATALSPGGVPWALSLYDISTGTLGKELVHVKWHWDPISGGPTQSNPKNFEPLRISFSRDGKWLALGGRGISKEIALAHHIQLWKIDRGSSGIKAKLERTFFAPQSASVSTYSPLVAFSADSTKLAFPYSSRYDKKFGTTGNNDRFQVYNLSTGEVKQLPAGSETPFSRYRAGLATPSTEDFTQSIFSSDGKRLFSGDRLVAWNMATGEVLSVLDTPALAGYYASPALALSPDDNTLATCHIDHSIQLWDVSEPKLREISAETQQRAEEVKSGKRKPPTEPAARPRAILRGHAAYVTAMVFHPDGKILASASIDRTIKLWDVVTGEVRLTLEGQAAAKQDPTQGWPVHLVFTPDGNTLISTDTGRTVKFWRAAPVD